MTVIHYDPSLTMREAPGGYFAINHFGADGGYNDPCGWTSRSGPVPLPFPNSCVEGARAALPRHAPHPDRLRHHVHRRAGDRRVGAGRWLSQRTVRLVYQPVGDGRVLASPRRIFRAFVRGLRSQSLYGQDAESLLSMQVRDVRDQAQRAERRSHVCENKRACSVLYRSRRALWSVWLRSRSFLPLSPIGIVVLNLRRRLPVAGALAT